jgi:hypothetical protein
MIGFEYLSFLYSNLGYNQIPMHPYDEEKTTFITNKGIFCYRKKLWNYLSTNGE